LFRGGCKARKERYHESEVLLRIERRNVDIAGTDVILIRKGKLMSIREKKTSQEKKPFPKGSVTIIQRKEREKTISLRLPKFTRIVYGSSSISTGKKGSLEKKGSPSLT